MALTKVSRGLLSTGIVDNSNATAITLNADESATFAAGINVTGTVTSDGLTVQTTNGLNALLESTTSYQYLQFKNSSATTNYIGFVNDDFVVNPPTGLKMTVTAEGNVGINTSLPSATDWGSANPVLQLSGTQPVLSLQETDVTDSEFQVAVSGQQFYIWDADASLARLIIDSSGNALVGGTVYEGSTTSNASSAYIASSGFISANVTNDFGMQVNRTGTDGTLINLRKNGSDIGTIGTNSGYMVIGSPVGTDAHLLIGNGLIHPATSTGGGKDAAIDLGGASNRFKDLYLSGGIDFNGSSGGINTANRSFKMDEYEIGTCTISFSTSGGGATLSRQDNATGYYQKTGDICTVQFYSGVLTFSNAGSGSARIHGLPFNSRGGTYNYGVCSITHSTATTTALQNGFTTPNVSHISLMQANTTSGAVWVTGGVRYLMFSVTYLTT